VIRSSTVPRLATLVAGALLAGLVGPSPRAGAADFRAEPGEGVRIQRILKTDLAENRISFEEYLVQNFRLVFAPDRVDARYAGEDRLLEHCFTPWIVEFTNARDSLSPATVREIESYLQPSRRLGLLSYVSPGGNFQLFYDTAGADAVPLDDVDPANGIPDFVERCAEYYDESWAVEVDNLGFSAPVLPGDDTYDCYFAALPAGLYGFTAPTGIGMSEITVDNDFVGFGHVPSPDPDGAQLGRAKGVICHEFKHASQRAQSGWSEGNWLELDANWVMDVVYDESDIYHAWLSDPTSQLRSPQTRLDDDSGEGNYEDLIWQTYMSERFGNQIIADFWDRRATEIETVKRSYLETLEMYGSGWDEAYPGYMEWCWFTGSRSIPGFGFEEASSMLRMTLLSAGNTYPVVAGTSVDQLAAHHRRFNPGVNTGYLEISFDGLDTHEFFTVSILAVEPDDTIHIVRPELDANKDMTITVTIPIEELNYAGMIVTNTRRSGGAQSYSINVELVGSATAAPELGTSAFDLALSAPSPNPFGASTQLRYALPVPGAARLDLFDVQGRRVRTLIDGSLPAGPAQVEWDGRSDTGAAAPAGVYWARLETVDGVVSRKITKIR